MPAFHPVIPAGGSGKRLWPLSRVGEPKFLMPIGAHGSSLLTQTLDRLGLLAPAAHAYVVTGERYAERIALEAPGLAPENVLAEPSPMDSGPAIALAAAVIAQRHPGSIMGSFAADHFIPDSAAFADAVRTAIAGAEQGLLMAVGIEPTRPETGYGYIHLDPGSERDGVFAVKQFKEKPSRETAEAFLASGEFLWNASMFVWQPETFLAELARRDERLHAGITRIAAAWDTPDRAATLAEVWPTLPKVAIEYVVMEPAAAEGLVGTVRGAFGWTDVGDFNALGDINEPDEHGNAVIGADRATVLAREARNVVVRPGADKLVAVIGVDDVAIVETDDVLLVCARDRVQDVKGLVESLGEISRDDLL